MDQFNLFKDAINTLEDNGFTVRLFEDSIMTLPELSYTIAKRKYDFGVYIDSNDARTSIKLLGENGRMLKEIEAERINQILEETDYNFSYESRDIDRVKLIPSSFRKQFEKKLDENLN
jgi:phosphomannomutase